MAHRASEILNCLLEDASIQGDSHRAFDGAVSISHPQAGKLSFIGPKSSIEPNDTARLSGMTIVCTQDTATLLAATDVTCIVTDAPRLAFLRALGQFLTPPPPAAGIHRTAIVDQSSNIAPTATIGPYCVVGKGCVIGPKTILHPHVTCYGNVEIGHDVTIHSGTVIGADGFGYERNSDGVLEKFPHVGGVRIGDFVEIGSNTSIDRGTLANTEIGNGVKIDNQCHISHNVKIGANSVVIAQSMIAGSVSIGSETWIAPCVSVLNQKTIGDRATVGMSAVVLSDVDNDTTVIGMPAKPMQKKSAY